MNKGLLGKAKIPVAILSVILVSFFVVTFVFPSVADSGSATLWTDKADYAPGEIVYIQGIGFNANAQVDIRVTRPDGVSESCDSSGCNVRFLNGLQTSDAEGDVLYAYDLDGIIGEYIVDATDGSKSAQITFTDARTINNVTLNGSSSVSVSPNASITVAVTVTTTGSGSDDNWQSTDYRIGESGSYTCVNTPDHNTAGTYTESFSITAPSAPGSYNVRFRAYSNNVCNQGQSATYTLTNGITVQNPQPYCGDGIINGNDVCDDGNMANGDGCSSTCSIEQGWSCTGQPSVCKVANQNLSNSCGIDMMLIMDVSGSISSTELSQMKTALNGFVDAFLPNTPTQIAVVKFDTLAQIIHTYSGNSTSIKNAINGASGGGFTNWQDALADAYTLFDNRVGKPDLYVFASDGNPNRYGDPAVTATEPVAVAQAVVKANQIKLSGIRIITLGIGSGVNSANMIAISSADAYYSSGFDTLADDLSELAEELCGGTITVKKLVDGQSASGWQFSASVAGGTPTPSTSTTDGTGFISPVFDIDISDTSATVNITETLMQGYGFVSASCIDQVQNPVGTPGQGAVTGIVVESNDVIYCEFHNTAHECESDKDCDPDYYTCDGNTSVWHNSYCDQGTYTCEEVQVPQVCDDQDPCTADTCDEQNGQCKSVFSDLIGPDTFGTAVDPPFNNGNFNATSETQDQCSPIEKSEYFLGHGGIGSCGAPGTGTPMNPTDGNFDQLYEALKKNGIQYYQDGVNWICVQSKDTAGNWGDCDCAYFDTDAIPPSCPFNITLDGKLYPQEYLVCGNNAWLNATVCDEQARIQGGEYFIDTPIPPVPAPWSGIWMNVLEEFSNGDFCAVIGALVNTSQLSEGTHLIKLRGKDAVENWGKIIGCRNVSLIKDTKPPITNKTLLPFEEDVFQCYGNEEGELPEDVDLTDGCYYVKAGTQIVLSAQDQDTPDHEFANKVRIHWKVWYKQNPGEQWSVDQEGVGAENQSVIINLTKDSYHLIEYWAVDACGWEEEHHFELDLVDTQPPVTEKEVLGPQYYDEQTEKFYIDGRTLIKMTCEDFGPHPVDHVKIYYRYFVDDVLIKNWTLYEEPFGFPEESKHTLEYYCVDALGNAELVDVEIDYVDHTPPVTTKRYGTPLIDGQGGYPKWITSQTSITLTADDGNSVHSSGVKKTYYRVTLVGDGYCEDQEACAEATGIGDFLTYSNPFTIGEESCHLIEYYSVDNVNKTEDTKRQCVYVDNTPPKTTKTVGEPKVEGTGEVDWWITQDTTITLDCSDQGNHPVNDVTLYYRDYLQGETPPAYIPVPEGYVEIQKEEDCKHVLEWYCVDALGNSEGVKTEIDQVDSAPPEIVKWVDDNTVQQGDTVRICANVTDKKLTGDPGVGVDWVKAKLVLGSDPIYVNLIKTEGDTYCGNWTVPQIKECYRCFGFYCEYRCVWELWVKAEDKLGNFNKTDGIQIIVDNAAPKIQSVLWPSKDKYYREGRKFEVKAIAIDFGGDENILNSDNCKASGVYECAFYAIKYDFESVNQSEIKNLWDYIDWMEETLEEPIMKVYLGSVPWVDGFCKGSLQFPLQSGLKHEDIVFLAYKIEDNSGNARYGLAQDWDGDKVTMKLDMEGPQVTIEESNLPGPFTKGDLISVLSSVEDIDSGYDECWADIYKCVGEGGSCSETQDTGRNLAGYGSGYDLCEISDSLPEGLTSGDYELRVNAGDELQNIGYAWAYFTVDNTRPSMKVVSPDEMTVYGDMLPVSLNVQDPSGIVDSTVKFRVNQIGSIGNIWCLLGCEDTGWITLTKQANGLYAGMINMTEYGIVGSGKYTFDAIACDSLYTPDEDVDNELGVDMQLDRNTMHCKQISLHGAKKEVRPQCDDGLDNDGDGYIDLSDIGCGNSSDDSEFNLPEDD